MEVFGMVVFVAFIALLVRSLFKKPNGKKLQKFVDNWEWAEPRNAGFQPHGSSPIFKDLPGNRYQDTD